jgi:hypothetical protein
MNEQSEEAGAGSAMPSRRRMIVGTVRALTAGAVASTSAGAFAHTDATTQPGVHNKAPQALIK